MAKVSPKKVLQYILFFGFGILIFYFVYRGQDPQKILNEIKEFNIGWILLSLGLAFLSHLVRALRWRMMIQPLGYSPGVINTFLAILVMYLANFAFPRLGEVSRCGVLTKYEKVPFTPQIGTVITERFVDLIILILIFLFVVLAQFGIITEFIENTRVKLGFESPLLQSGLFLGGIVAFVVICGLLFYIFKDRILSNTLVMKIQDLVKKFMLGLLSIRKMKNPGLFVIYSLLIYLFYFLMTYVVMLGYEPTMSLGPGVALTVFVMGSIGMVLPVQGGFGTYHFFVIETLLILGVARPEGQTLALVLHGSMTIFLIFIGLVALLILPLLNREAKSIVKNKFF